MERLLLLLTLWCCLQYSVGQTFLSTQLTEQFLKQERDSEECYIQSSFGGSRGHYGLSDTHLDLKVASDRGVILTGAYASEGKAAIETRVQAALRTCQSEYQQHFTNISRTECMAKNYVTLTRDKNATITGSITLLTSEPFVQIWAKCVTSPLINLTKFTVFSDHNLCSEAKCNKTFSFDNDTCFPIVLNYSVSITATSDLELTQYDILQMITIVVDSNTSYVGTMCNHRCLTNNTIDTSNKYYPAINLTTEGNCVLQTQRAIKDNTSLAIQLSVSDVHVADFKQTDRCNQLQPNYIKHYTHWVELNCYQQLINATHCNKTLASIIFSLYQQKTNESLMLLNETFPLIYMFQDYNTPLRPKDISYVHCQQLARDTKKRIKRSAEKLDRTSNFMLCVMQGYKAEKCEHLNDRLLRAKRSPPPPVPPRNPPTPIRMSTVQGGEMQGLNNLVRRQAIRRAHRTAGSYAEPHYASSMENILDHSNEARRAMYSRAHRSMPDGLESPVERSPLNTDPQQVIYSQVAVRSASANNVLEGHYAQLQLSQGGPQIRGGSEGAIYSSIKKPDIYAKIKKRPPSDVVYSTIDHPPPVPPKDPVPPLPPRNVHGFPIAGRDLPPPLPPRSSSLGTGLDLPPPLPPRDPTPSKLQNFLDKFKVKKSSSGCDGGSKRSAIGSVCSMRAKPFGGDGKTNPKLSEKPMRMLDPDNDGVYGVGKSNSLGNGEHVHVSKNNEAKNQIGVMMGAMMVSMMSQQMSMSTKDQISDIVNGKYNNVDQGKAIALVVLQKLDEVGNTMATAGSTAAMMGAGPAGLAVAAVGLATQTIVGFVTMSIQIYDIRFPRDPPIDSVLGKYTEYASMMNSPTAGNTWCLMPESVLNVAISFDDQTNILKKDQVEFWVPTYKTVIKVGYNVDVIFNANLQVTCAGGGQLRFEDYNIHSVATKQSDTAGGSSVYNVHGVGLMMSNQAIVKGTCGGSTEPNLILVREDVPSSDMILLRKRGPGEPKGSENMHSDVCDKFPFKKFYVAVPGCSADRSKTHIAWTTCSMMFRKSVWNNVDNAWMVANPFVSDNSDRKVFVFKRRDFRNVFPIRPNINQDHAKLCNNADEPFLCRLPDPMILTDTTTCNNKLRFYRVYLHSGHNSGYNSLFDFITPMYSVPRSSRNVIGYMLTCPLNTIATHLMKRGNEATNLVVHDVDTFGSVRKYLLIATEEHSTPVVWIFCQHSTKVGHQSDVIELQIEGTHVEHKPLDLTTKWLNDDHTRFAMYNISRRGPVYQGPYVYVDVNKVSDYRKSIRLANPVKVFVAGGSNNINEEWDLRHLENHWIKNGESTWKWASLGCKTISSLQINFGLCNVTNLGQLEMTPLGWWTWSFLDQTQQESSTKYVASTEWVFKPGQNTYQIGKTTYTHKMKYCHVKLSLTTKMLSVSCDTTDITKSDLTNSETCLTVSPASDQCNTEKSACGTRTKEWYNLDNKRAQWESGSRYTSNWHNTPGSEPQLAYQFFCQDEGVYWSHIDNTNRYSVFVYHRPLDANMPVVASYQSGNTISEHDRVIAASKLKLVQQIQNQLNRLFDMTKDPMAEAINEFSKGLLNYGPNITNVNVNVHDLVENKRIRDNSIYTLQTQLDNNMMDLMIDAVENTDWFNYELNMTKYKCCYVNVNASTVTSVDKDIYVCPLFDYFMENVNDVNYSRILGPDNRYHDRAVITQLFGDPYFTCLSVQDIVFADNDTLNMFSDMLLDEMTKEELMLMADNTTYNVLRMLESVDQESPDGFFEASQYNYSVSPYGYTIKRIKSVDHAAVSLVSFSFAIGMVILIVMFYVSRKCRRLKRRYLVKDNYTCSNNDPVEQISLRNY